MNLKLAKKDQGMVSKLFESISKGKFFFDSDDDLEELEEEDRKMGGGGGGGGSGM